MSDLHYVLVEKLKWDYVHDLFIMYSYTHEDSLYLEYSAWTSTAHLSTAQDMRVFILETACRKAVHVGGYKTE